MQLLKIDILDFCQDLLQLISRQTLFLLVSLGLVCMYITSFKYDSFASTQQGSSKGMLA